MRALVGCLLPAAAAQMATSGAQDAAALHGAKAAADLEQCHGINGRTSQPCPLDTWDAAGPCSAEGFSSNIRGWTGVTCDEKDGRVVAVRLGDAGLAGELLPFFGRLGALLFLGLSGNGALRGDLADLTGATELRALGLFGCPLGKSNNCLRQPSRHAL